ncbi:MAG: glycosyltransferase family 2 protein, partial [Candidatus Ratteibacteria bacterium]
MKLSIIVPVYNEKSTMASIIQKVLEVPLDKEIIIVDDGSTDGTTDIIKQMKDRYPEIKAYFMEKNMGKGYAIRMGLQEATGDVIVIQDADLEYDPMDFLVLIKPIMDGRADVVYGSRILGKNPKSSFSFYVGGRLLSFLSNLLYGTSITDEPTCYKMFKS